jgi:hypothetical protein
MPTLLDGHVVDRDAKLTIDRGAVIVGGTVFSRRLAGTGTE